MSRSRPDAASGILYYNTLTDFCQEKNYVKLCENFSQKWHTEIRCHGGLVILNKSLVEVNQVVNKKFSVAKQKFLKKLLNAIDKK